MALPLRVTLSPERLDVVPGDAPTVAVTVTNTSDVVEHYVIDPLGLPEGWQARVEPEVTKLRPGETGTASITFGVRREPPAPAVSQVLGVLVRSRYREDVSCCEELPLTVAPVDRVALRIEPEVASGGRSAWYAVDVTNTGNTPVRLRLTATDPERRVLAQFQPPTVDLPTGTTVRALLTVKAPVPWNREKQRTLNIEAVGVGVAGQIRASFVQRPRFASRLTRVAGLAGGVLVLAAAVVVAALIARPGPSATPPTTPVAGADTGPSSGGNPVPAPSATAPAATPTAPTVTPTVAATPDVTSAAPSRPRDIDLTRPPGVSEGFVPSDAFREQGILLSGKPDPDGPPECATATATAVRVDGSGNRFLTAARPDGTGVCDFVPVQIRFVEPAASVEIRLGGSGERRLEVVYRDLSRTVEDDLTAEDDGRRGGIDYVVVRGLPADLTPVPPPAALQRLQFTPLPR
ncbi:COG1470 family protein [Plantactinospora sonchi]|uniref:Alpha-galactosidase NEW3 domain-containing protein n=1 Tax=Plantactinospora sonchi TaxID=1544735 RepID=A0ABU7RR54_9ACTN